MRIWLKNLILLVFCVGFLVQCSGTAQKRSFGEVVDDNVIGLKLRTKLTKDKEVAGNKIKLRVWKGVVTLTGTQNRQSQINRAIELAEQQGGVREVKAYLVLESIFKSEDKANKLWKVKTKKDDLEEKDLMPKKEFKPKSEEQNEVKAPKKVDVIESADYESFE